MKKILILTIANIFLLGSVAFANMDKDVKRIVTKDEYLKMAEKRFNKIDANKDGTLTLRERKQAKKLDYKKRKDLKGETKKS